MKGTTSNVYDLNRRTSAQNRLYWGVLRTLAERAGIPPEDLHAELKGTILREMGARSTRDLTPEGFGQYMERLPAWAFRTLHIDDVAIPVAGRDCRHACLRGE